MSRIEDCLVDARMPTKFGTFQLFAFPGDDETKEDLALVMGDRIQMEKVVSLKRCSQ